jgi:monomeric sarcosine oxidase
VKRLSESYDVLVLGVGGVGSAALFHLAVRGLRVLGIDRFSPGHDQGSSHGQTRLIRQAYFEHPAYVPLVQRAYTLWSELEERSGQSLYRQVGILEAGPAGGAIVPGVLASARQHRLPVEPLDAEQLRRRFPGFDVPDDFTAVFEARAGFLRVEDCVRAHVDQAVRSGARLLVGAAVRSWHREGTGFRVVTDAGEFLAGHLVISAGAWARDLLAGLGIPLQVVRKSLYWFKSPHPVYDVDRGAPGFIFETPDGEYYGFPNFLGAGLKCAEHSGGVAVDDPLQVDRRPIAEETQRVQRFLARYLPHASTEVQDFAVCLYTLSPDRTFIVDIHPDDPHVSFAAGLSGHGFKFTSVLGEILADLALHGKSPLPIEFMACKRFGK